MYAGQRYVDILVRARSFSHVAGVIAKHTGHMGSSEVPNVDVFYLWGEGGTKALQDKAMQ